MFNVTMGINAGHIVLCYQEQHSRTMLRVTMAINAGDGFLLPWAELQDSVWCYHGVHCWTMFSVTTGINAGHCFVFP